MNIYEPLKYKKGPRFNFEFPGSVQGFSPEQKSTSLRNVPGHRFEGTRKKASCSEATIVRLAKRLGYEGYPELKRDFAAYSKAEAPVEYENISSGDSPADIMTKIFKSSISALQDTMNIISKEESLKAVEYISESEKIVFTGFGDAGIVASEAHQKFVRAGKQSYYSPDPDIQLIYVAQLKKGDVLLAVSHSGRTKPLINTVKAAKDRGARILSITNFPVSVLTKKSDVVLQTAAFARSVSGEVISKRLTALCIVESLYLNWLMIHQNTVLPVLKRSNEIVKINKHS